MHRNLQLFRNNNRERARVRRARVSRDNEERILRAALEVEFYRRRYKPSNKNDNDLPVVG